MERLHPQTWRWWKQRLNQKDVIFSRTWITPSLEVRGTNVVCVGCGPLPVTVTTRIIIFLVGNPYKPSFTTVTVRGPYPRYAGVNGDLLIF